MTEIQIMNTLSEHICQTLKLHSLPNIYRRLREAYEGHLYWNKEARRAKWVHGRAACFWAGSWGGGGVPGHLSIPIHVFIRAHKTGRFAYMHLQSHSCALLGEEIPVSFQPRGSHCKPISLDQSILSSQSQKPHPGKLLHLLRAAGGGASTTCNVLPSENESHTHRTHSMP